MLPHTLFRISLGSISSLNFPNWDPISMMKNPKQFSINPWHSQAQHGSSNFLKFGQSEFPLFSTTFETNFRKNPKLDGITPKDKTTSYKWIVICSNVQIPKPNSISWLKSIEHDFSPIRPIR